MKRTMRLALAAMASVAFFFGVAGAILFFPGDGNQLQEAHGASSRVVWVDSFRTASKLAKDEHKYVLADVYTDWCGWCKRLDKDVFTKAKLGAYLKKEFVCVKVNAEDPKEGEAVAQSYNVNSYPCALVFNPEGELVGRISGYEEAPDYMQTLQEIVAGKGSK